MENPSDITQPGFWNERYSGGKTPWDLGGIPSKLPLFLSKKTPGHVLIPGCGWGHEIHAFIHSGWKVTAIDFSERAVDGARRRLGGHADVVICGDFFSHVLPACGFDLVYERTFLCALPRGLWPDYARRMGELLKTGGLLAGLFLYGHEPDPPPQPLEEGEAANLFEGRFELQRSEEVKDSPPLFLGKERWQEWVRIQG